MDRDKSDRIGFFGFSRVDDQRAIPEAGARPADVVGCNTGATVGHQAIQTAGSGQGVVELGVDKASIAFRKDSA